MIKTIWNPGDIITSEKWNKINNNSSILGAYQLPVIQSQDNDSSIIIDKSYNEIATLLKQGVICYFILGDNGNNLSICIITKYNDSTQVLKSGVDSLYVLNVNQMYLYVEK